MKIGLAFIALLLMICLSVTATASQNAAVPFDDEIAFSSSDPRSNNYTPSTPQLDELDEAYVLLIRDVIGWYPSNEDVMNLMPEVDYVIAPSSQFAGMDLSEFTFIIVAGNQTPEFNQNILDNMTLLQDYVNGGGWLYFHFGTNTHTPHLVLWDGTTYDETTPYENNNYMGPDGNGHPILDGIVEPYYGTSANHGSINVAPLGTLVIIVDSQGNPTTIEYNYGSGKVVASTTPLEHSYYFGYNIGETLWNTIAWMANRPTGPVTIDLLPIVDTVPPAGGQLLYDVHLWSTIGLSYPGLRYQTFATLPAGGIYGPIDNIPWNLVPFMDVYVAGRTIDIPAFAPVGEYYLEARAGVPGNPAMQVTDGFPFWKQSMGYVEDFEDGLAQNFSWYHDNGGTHAINGGYAKIYQAAVTGWGSGVYTGSNFDNATTTVVFDYQVNDLSRGLMFRGDGPRDANYNGYNFYIAHTIPGYSLWKYNNGVSTNIVAWTTTTLNPTTNTLSIVTSGSNFDMYLNGSYLGSVSDADHASGYSGIITAGSDVWFDEISVIPDAVPPAAQPMQQGELVAGNYDDLGRPTDQIFPTTKAVFFDRSEEINALRAELNFNPEDMTGAGAWIATKGETAVNIPTEYVLENSYPNPFNPTTTVSVVLPQSAELTLAVFNITGQKVAELANGSFNSGRHQFIFDGSGLSSGIYFVKATVPGHLNQVQKVMLVR